ncbi:alcohol dehydrogenase catalytic domain-containing protein [Jannaschia seohaensis]|uniref:S-(Hydroxymethyl)mycothiol dehydrogenase n=1 Tax=Jannaschia seohaensis TaxID=475081 RepID=A0A2Y9AX98_9RHOB|nr:alcohol dehydrogenase catalytic domain-containing protein [Jannaschia seohaensis]PWJ18134.1 S-(hydroxymethyl)mycothiol dehydrogenase [Jannaschia seohaensis]SSA46659.1 S-(hydroxymethyl)mycothiol dehydrogenase [Jannaschia seohaensis]
MREIRAAVCRSFGAPLEIETLRLADPGPGEVQVDIEAVAICHSDITYADGGFGGDLPAVYGHEAVGRVAALGEGVTGLGVGSRVLVTLIRACGDCPACAGGRATQCATPGATAPLTTREGDTVLAAMNCGAFAEAVTVDASQLAPLGDEIAPEAACILSCGVVTGLGAAVNTAKVRPGDWCVVIGAGGVGLNTIQGARLAGAARIVAVDVSEEKLDSARAFGATDGVLAGEDGHSAMMRIGRLADHVFVTVGAKPVIDRALDWCAPHGTAYLVGMPHVGTVGHFDPVNAAYYGQGLRGTRMGDVVLRRDVPWLLDLHAQGRLKLEELVSGTYPLEAINEAMAATRAGQGRRNVVVMA